MLKQLGQEPEVIAALEPLLPGYEIDTWRNNYPELLAAITTKNGVMNIFSVIILMIAGIGILNLLLMAVYERTREIGLLGAMGLKPRQISLLFILEGTLMGLVGVAAGIALGLADQRADAQVWPGFQRHIDRHRLHGADQRARLSQLGAGEAARPRPDGSDHLSPGGLYPGLRSRPPRAGRSPASRVR